MTRLLIEKNKQLAELRNKDVTGRTETHQSYSLAGDANSINEEFEVNLYDQHILTGEDWSSFKVYFENAYPGFLRRLRGTYPSMTEAEERLYLFIKLNLSTKEAATILGISPESVKKTRNRLRKRLELSEDINLENYIQAF